MPQAAIRAKRRGANFPFDSRNAAVIVPPMTKIGHIPLATRPGGLRAGAVRLLLIRL
ncbi:hypothetical protein SAMN05444340_11412 [Citreimonas salinaria]|uniref:Uncharacterized protein n=2 Tax=Citreimonas salinaria TaxID=321339 RepID=A0A1H3LQJ6_9RHOB|nr:hypothetical protein SAMN05444340_11412 [Citreimonas salinaria]